MEDLIVSILANHEKLKDSELDPLVSEHISFTVEEKVQAINSLLHKGKLTLIEENGEAVYSLLSANKASIMKKLEADNILLLQIIRESGAKGIWNGDIKSKTGMPILKVNKCLNNLEKQGLIFSKKSVNMNKKIWFTEGVKPSNDVTGGFLFADHEFDKNLMDDLFTQVKLLLSEKASSIKEVLGYVKQQVNNNIKEENIKEVLQSMIALNEIEENHGKYKISNSFFITPIVLPCLACKLRFECKADGVVNPADCEYLNSWLDF